MGFRGALRAILPHTDDRLEKENILVNCSDVSLPGKRLICLIDASDDSLSQKVYKEISDQAENLAKKCGFTTLLLHQEGGELRISSTIQVAPLTKE